MQTKKLLKKEGIEFVEINIDDDDEIRQQLLKEGWMSMPVVKSSTESWSGFRPDRIRNI